MDGSTKALSGYTDKAIALAHQRVSTHSIEIIDCLADLRELKAEWEQIAPVHSVEPWQSFSWMEAAATAYHRRHALRIITIKKQGRLVAVAPLVLKPSDQPLKPMQLHFLGGEELKEPNRFIFNDEHCLDLLLDVVVSEPRFPIRLSRIPNESRLVERILKKFKKAGWVVRVMHMPYPYLNLTGKIIKKSLKKDLRRAKNKAKRLFGLPTYDPIGSNNANELRHYLQQGFQIEASGWKGKNNTAILSTDARKDFFDRYAHTSMAEGTLRLAFLSINGKTAAVQYAVETMKNYWLLNVGYDETFRECSPGNLLLEMTVKAAAAKGLTRYNLLGKEEPWTRRWTQCSEDCFVLAAYHPNLNGVKSMLSDGLYLLQKRLKDRRKETLKKASS